MWKIEYYKLGELHSTYISDGLLMYVWMHAQWWVEQNPHIRSIIANRI